VEADASWRFHKLDVIAGYQYVDVVVTSFAAGPALVGLEVPEVAPQQFTLETRYAMPRGWKVATQARASSSQFYDDLNQFLLAPFFHLDAYLSKRLRNGTEVFAVVENITDSQVQVAKTPTLNMGPPIVARVGVSCTGSKPEARIIYVRNGAPNAVEGDRRTLLPSTQS
jgi:outer membrane receptor protein involved in Fe transport